MQDKIIGTAIGALVMALAWLLLEVHTIGKDVAVMKFQLQTYNSVFQDIYETSDGVNGEN